MVYSQWIQRSQMDDSTDDLMDVMCHQLKINQKKKTVFSKFQRLIPRFRCFPQDHCYSNFAALLLGPNFQVQPAIIFAQFVCFCGYVGKITTHLCTNPPFLMAQPQTLSLSYSYTFLSSGTHPLNTHIRPPWFSNLQGFLVVKAVPVKPS